MGSLGAGRLWISGLPERPFRVRRRQATYPQRTARAWAARSVSVLEPPAGVACLDDVAVMGQAVEHSSRHFGIAKNLWPVCKGEIGGDEQRRVFIEFADQVEQQLAAGLAERQIAEFVDDDDVVAQQRLGKPAAATGGLLLLELIDQIDQVEEPAACTAADDRRCHADTEVRFAGARRTRGILPNITPPKGGSFIGITLATVRASRS
jgi:hypothetical protein